MKFRILRVRFFAKLTFFALDVTHVEPGPLAELHLTNVDTGCYKFEDLTLLVLGKPK